MNVEPNGTANNEVDINSVLNLVISRSGVQSKVHIKDAQKVEKIVEELISSGPESLQVITDFDATLSCYHSDGKQCATSYGIIQNSVLTPPDVKSRGKALFDHYHQIEIDASISEEERSEKMHEWYEKKHENYLNASVKVNSAKLTEVVKAAHVVLRDRSHEVLKKLSDASIPTLVFSAGNGNSVVEVLKQNGVYYSTVKVIANFMEFDETTKDLVAFSKPLIHPGNKNEAALHETHSNYFDSLSARRNAILLGDNIGDANMATGMPNQKAILKIGYVNFNFDQHTESFKNVFDIVLVDDQSMCFMDALLDLIIKGTSL